VQVASVPTLISRPTAVERANLMIIDEAHHYTTKNSYQRRSSTATRARW
jgi:superfamily II DNA or RNA helicase